MAFSIHRDYVFMAIQHIASRSSNKISTPSPLNHFQLRASPELFGFLLRVAIKSGSLQSWLILMLIKFMDVLVISRSKLLNIFYFRLRYFFPFIFGQNVIKRMRFLITRRENSWKFEETNSREAHKKIYLLCIFQL